MPVLKSPKSHVRPTAKTLAEQFDARAVEINKLMKGKLDSERTQELADAMRKAGLPI